MSVASKARKLRDVAAASFAAATAPKRGTEAFAVALQQRAVNERALRAHRAAQRARRATSDAAPAAPKPRVVPVADAAPSPIKPVHVSDAKPVAAPKPATRTVECMDALEYDFEGGAADAYRRFVAAERARGRA
jgi:hypothetical protein